MLNIAILLFLYIFSAYCSVPNYTSIWAFCARVHYQLATAFTRLLVSLPNTPPFVRLSDISLHLFYYPTVSPLRRDFLCVWNNLPCVPCRFRLYTSRLKAISLVSCMSPHQIVAETNHVRETGHEVSKRTIILHLFPIYSVLSSLS